MKSLQLAFLFLLAFRTIGYALPGAAPAAEKDNSPPSTLAGLAAQFVYTDAGRLGSLPPPLYIAFNKNGTATVKYSVNGTEQTASYGYIFRLTSAKAGSLMTFPVGNPGAGDMDVLTFESPTAGTFLTPSTGSKGRFALAPAGGAAPVVAPAAAPGAPAMPVSGPAPSGLIQDGPVTMPAAAPWDIPKSLSGFVLFMGAGPKTAFSTSGQDRSLDCTSDTKADFYNSEGNPVEDVTCTYTYVPGPDRTATFELKLHLPGAETMRARYRLVFVDATSGTFTGDSSGPFKLTPHNQAASHEPNPLQKPDTFSINEVPVRAAFWYPEALRPLANLGASAGLSPEFRNRSVIAVGNTGVLFFGALFNQDTLHPANHERTSSTQDSDWIWTKCGLVLAQEIPDFKRALDAVLADRGGPGKRSLATLEFCELSAFNNGSETRLVVRIRADPPFRPSAIGLMTSTDGQHEYTLAEVKALRQLVQSL